jgi:hypothetical protein
MAQAMAGATPPAAGDVAGAALFQGPILVAA